MAWYIVPSLINKKADGVAAIALFQRREEARIFPARLSLHLSLHPLSKKEHFYWHYPRPKRGRSEIIMHQIEPMEQAFC